MELYELLSNLNRNYQPTFTKIELFREGGNSTYVVYTETSKYFLKCTGPAFSDTMKTSIEVNLYLKRKEFPVPGIILTIEEKPFVMHKENILVLYEYLETSEIDMKKDAEEVGALIGQMHHCMEDYPGQLLLRDKEFYIDRYIEILRKKQYPMVDEFIRYGDRLWDRVSKLPFGYSHGDLYCGNIERSADGTLYVLDLDTSCIGFPLYDLALICNRTDYFRYDEKGLSETLDIYKRFLTGYRQEYSISKCDAGSLTDMLALYHFALQATIIEVNGLTCVDHAFLDRQLSWLKQWEQQCSSEGLHKPVILLNGPSSSGKSTLAKALKEDIFDKQKKTFTLFPSMIF